MAERIVITECPRDAMQGIKDFIPTEVKIDYLNQLLKTGFDILDCGSFVSAKAIPQLADTHEVINSLDLTGSQTKLLTIIANSRGAEDAVKHEKVHFLGFPFSVSETFQQRNTNSGLGESLKRVEEIQEMCVKNNKEMLVYLSMAFGNPYGDPWSADLVTTWAKRISQMGIKHIALADTIGVSAPENISPLFGTLIPELKGVRVIAHLHSTPFTIREKVHAAWEAGCRNFDVALKGFGGCPMAKDDLTGNVATEVLLDYCTEKNITHGVVPSEMERSMLMANAVFLHS